MGDTSSNLEQALQEIAFLRTENAQLSNDLGTCKDHLFALLQAENDIPEESVKDAFTRILAGIDSWIDDASADEEFDFDQYYAQAVGNPDAGYPLDSLGIEQDFLEVAWLKTLGTMWTCPYTILSLVIVKWFMDDLLMLQNIPPYLTLYPLGLTQSQREVIAHIERAMHTDQEKRRKKKPSY